MPITEPIAARVVAEIIGREKGYVNHRSDLGGPTRWGITEATARAAGYTGDMRDLPRELAEAIIHADFVVRYGFDLVIAVSAAIGAEVADSAVNMGPAAPSVWLQRWLAAFNRQGRDYPDIVVDGRIGPRTIAALRAYLKVRGAEGEQVLVRALNASQGARYLELAEGREANEDFLFGWIRARVLEPA